MYVAGHQQWNSNIVFRFFPDEKKLIVLLKMEFLEWLFSLGKCSQNIRHLALSSWKTDEKKAKNWCIPALIRKMKIGLIALERHLERGCSMMDSGALHRSSPSGKPRSPLKQPGAGHYVWPLGWLRYGVFFFFFFFCNTLEDVQRHCTSARIFSSPSHLPSDTDIQPVHGKGDFCRNGLARDKQRDSSSLRKNYFSWV